MPADSSSRATLRTIVVIALGVFILWQCLPDIRRVWLPLGVFGVTGVDLDLFVTGVEPQSPAARARIEVGDRIDPTGTVPERRFWVINGIGPETLIPGQQLTIGVVHAGQRRSVTMTSVSERLSLATKALLLAREFALLLFVGIGAALVLLRPSAATWAFYFVCLGLNSAPGQVAEISVPLPWNYISAILGSNGLLTDAGLAGVLVFAALFLHEQGGGWRTTAYRAAPFIWLVLGCLSTYWWVAFGYFGLLGKAVYNVLLVLEACLLVLAMSAFVATYVSAQGSDKQRIRWIVVGFGIALAATFVADVLTTIIPVPYWFYASLLLLPVVVPLTVGYAVIKHRVIDVSFVVSRAIVYAILTTLLVGVFSLVDWLFIEKLRLERFGTIVEMGVAVAGGIWFQSLHKRVDDFTDAILFRQRHRAEIQLARDAAALPLAETPETIAHFLVDEPFRALSLASAALFRRERDGAYVREAARGWGPDTLSRLDRADEPLLVLARTENGPLSLYDHPWRTERTPMGAAQPVLALPVFVRRELVAIALYGSHVHGEALDPDEVKAIGGLAVGAAAAYDHLEAEALRKENDTLRVALAEAQVQPA